MPVEVTKTVIEKDGSKSITRENPNKYAPTSAADLRSNSVTNPGAGSFMSPPYNGSINLSNQANAQQKGQVGNSPRAASQNQSNPYQNKSNTNA